MPSDFKMNSEGEEANMELAFVREASVSQREKVKAFWKLLDSQNCLQPHEGISQRKSPPETEASRSVSSVEEIMKEKDLWRNGLRIFRRLGLDKTALAADDRCKLCLAHKMIQCKDLADTVMQPYEELNAEMEAFEQRQKSRDSSQGEASHVIDESNRCNSNLVKTKK